MPITPETLAFLGENRLRNNRDWFHENKPLYRTLVQEPLLELSAQIGPIVHKIDPLITTEPKRTLSRLWRDVRFSKDPSLFREEVWLVFRRGKGMEYPSFFFEFSPLICRYGVGYYSAPTPVMQTVRRWVLEKDKRFLAAQKAYKSLPGFVIEGDEYKRNKYPDAPPEEQPWLNRKNIVVLRNESDAQILFSTAFQKLAPIYQMLLEAHLTIV